MKYLYLSLLFITCSFSNSLWANCPGCIIDLPAGMAEDTLFLGTPANGTTNIYYDEDVSFRMPKTTDPVNELDPDVPAGLNIVDITILGISNLPPGLSWESNESVYLPQDETDGCIKFCGTPLVPGTYMMEVTVEATVFVVTQQISFPMEITIEPGATTNDGFSLLNNAGCGEVTVSFTNNIPSNGNTGYTYNWDFGNGFNSSAENPGDLTYTQPGSYVINYNAAIDTVGHILTKVRITDIGCFDIPTGPDFSNNPDMQIEIKDANGVLLYESDTIWNTDPPVEYALSFELTPGENYLLRVIDADSGINGGDDICAETNFNTESNGTVSGSDWELVFEIINPVEMISATDTVFVYEVPDQPTVFNSGADEFCAGETVTLSSSYNDSNQWYMDGEIVIGETATTFEVFESGIYQVEYTSADGCSAISEEQLITINENPEIPEYSNTNNLLSLLESITYDLDIALQWFQDGVELVGETSTEYCALESGIYTLEATNTNTGCVTVFTQEITVDGNLDCFTSNENLASEIDLRIYPNPVADRINISMNLSEATDVEIRFYDMLGRLQNNEVLTRHVYGTALLQPIPVDYLPAGIHLIELRINERTIVQKFVKN